MMAPPNLRFFCVLFLLLPFLALEVSGGSIGVNYGRDADNLIPPERVVTLLQSEGIGRVKIFDTDPSVLRAFSGSGIDVEVALPNPNLADASRADFAADWVRRNVAAYLPSTRIRAVAVGNEVSTSRADLNWALLPAMRNVHAALAGLGLADTVKVSSPIAFSTVEVSFPPSAGRFRGDLVDSVMRPMLEFIASTNSYIMINLYPFYAYSSNPGTISLDYSVFRPNPGVVDPKTGLRYFSLFDAQLDALYSAVSALGFGGALHGNATVGARMRASSRGSESGWPSKGGGGRITSGSGDAAYNGTLGQQEIGASKENAAAYNGNLVQKVLSGRTGTPLHPDADLDVDLFALFNENRKPGAESERNYGLFYPDGQKVYDIEFRLVTWCVAREDVDQQRLQGALDWACGSGGADCGPIQPGGACYEPNTVVAHASYAFNSYYQRNRRAAGTCDFQGVARVVSQRPVFGSCQFPTRLGDPPQVHPRSKDGGVLRRMGSDDDTLVGLN